MCKKAVRGAADIDRFIDDVVNARRQSDDQTAVEEVVRRMVANPRAVMQELGEGRMIYAGKAA